MAEEMIRIVANVPKSLKKRAQIRAIENGVNLTDLIIGLLESELASTEEKSDPEIQVID